MIDFPQSPTLWQTFSTVTGTFKWDGTAWVFGEGNGPTVSGGTVSVITGGYQVHTFTGDGTLTVTKGAKTVEILVVGGGGGGGSNSGPAAGGGGAGQVITSSAYALPVGVHPVTIGIGGVGVLTNSVDGTDGGTTTVGSLFTAIGGGGGAGVLAGVGHSGASGGGGCGSTAGIDGAGGVGTAGFSGGTGFGGSSFTRTGGGGGGATEAGVFANTSALVPHGGKGISSSISGTALFYADGGCGEFNVDGHSPVIPLGGNGTGGKPGDMGTANATANRGSGGGAGGVGGFKAGDGSAGIVIVRYQL